MGACCCKTKIVITPVPKQSHEDVAHTQLNDHEQNTQQGQVEQLDATIPTADITNVALDIANQDDNQNLDPNDPFMREHRSSTQHWKAQTLQLLTFMADDMDLGSDFEDYDFQFKEADDYEYKTNIPPKKLINVPRKIYISKHQKIKPPKDANIQCLKIGTTLNKGNYDDETSVWRSCNASHFRLRGIQYLTNKKNKLQHSKDALYDVFAVDCFEINDKDAMDIDVHEMIKCFDIKYINKLQTKKYPNIIVFSLMVPLFKKKERNGLHILIYSKISNVFENILDDANCDKLPSLQLLDKFLNCEDIALNAFKMTLSIPNVKETTLNQMTKKLVKTINGKCMAFKKHATYGYMDINDTQGDVFVVGFNGFGLNKKIIKGLSVAKEHLHTIDFEIGFHIGTKTKQMLPERILLCTKLIKLNIGKFVRFDVLCEKCKEEMMDVDKPRGHSRAQTYVMDDIAD